MSFLEVKTEIRTHMYSGEISDALKKLRKLDMVGKFDTVSDKVFVNYNLAWCYNKMGNLDMAKHYIAINNELVDANKSELMLQYYQNLWLYSEIFKDELSTEEYCCNFIEIYKYYKLMDDVRFSNGAIEMVLLRQGNEKDIQKFINKKIREFGINNQLVIDMVKDLASHHIYIVVEEPLRVAI